MTAVEWTPGQEASTRRLSVIILDIIGLQSYEFKSLFPNFLAHFYSTSSR